MTKILRNLRKAVLLADGAGLTDGELLDCFLSRREEAALAALVRRHSPMVWGVCRRVLWSHHDAEDAFQATFLVLVRRAASIRPRDMVANWLYGVAYQTALKTRGTVAKRAKRERQVAVMPEPKAVKQRVRNDLQHLLDQELSSLPDKHRVVIVLCDLEENTREEAARQLGVPQGTVASRLARARKMLGRRLARHGLGLSGAALAAALSESVAAACVPTSAVARAVQVANLSAAGKATGGLISGNVAALTEGVLKFMSLTKLQVATALLLTVGMLAAGAATLCLPEVKATHQHGRQDEAARQRKGRGARLHKDHDKVDHNDASAILDKAIKAIGGEARLKQANTVAWKARGKSFQDGNEYPFTNETIVQGVDQLRMEWEDDFNGNRVTGITILNGDKGWRKYADKSTKLDGAPLANHKRNLYLLVVPVTLVPLKDKAFRIEPAGELQVGDKPAIGLKVTGPDGKDFNLFFHKKSGLLVKVEVRMGSPGKEFTQETMFGDYKEFDGIKRATMLERRRDGVKILEQEITEFRVLDKVAPETFAEPK